MIASAAVSTAALMKSPAGVSAPSETTLYPAFSSAIDRMRLPTICVSEPITPVTSVLILDIDLTQGSPPLALLPEMAEQRITERDGDEHHHAARDRPREQPGPVVP